MKINLITWGATLQSILVKDKDENELDLFHFNFNNKQDK